MARLLSPLIAAASLCAACSGPSGPQTPVLAATEQIVPSSGMPSDLEIQQANNNLDVVAHGGRVYLAFRTAPSHFASKDAVIHIVSSADERTWTHEASFNRQTDLREPRFLSLGSRLFLYFAVLGENAVDFEPHGFMVTERTDEKTWSAPEDAYLPGFIPWRAKVIAGTAYLTAYKGGEGIYDENPEPTEIHFLTTHDGRAFEPVVSGKAKVEGGGGSETAFVILDGDGPLVAVIRNEAGDATGWGSKICRAEAEQLADWSCTNDPKKYDSPLMFEHEGEPYLIGRRGLANAGRYDLNQREKSHREQTLTYQLEWSGSPKRCALWHVNRETLEVTFLVDLPSRGDTCFPGLLVRGENRFSVYNYSSPIDGPDLNWLEAQLGPTNIYRTDFELVEP